MTAPRSSLAAALLAALALASTGAPAAAKVALVETEPFTWELGGYLRTVTGLQWLGLDAPSLPEALRPPARIGLNATVLRAEWRFSFGTVATLDVHNRFAWLLSSDALPGGGAGGAGLGVSAPPARTVDLRSPLIEDPTLTLEHDLDRLVLRLFLGPLDVSLGRQAITWGQGLAFTVADVWAAFSPFDLDTSQKRGIDALRVIGGVGDDVELDFIVADRGSLGDLSGGVRATFYLGFGDLYVAAGKFWREIGLMAGVSAEVDVVKLRAEAAGSWDLDAEALLLPRVTLGVDWFVNADVFLNFELHFNGYGAADDADYPAQAQSARVGRGQTYLLGRYYAGVVATYKPHELVTLSLTTFVNLVDPSAMLAWGVSYAMAEDIDVSLGGFHGLGPHAVIALDGVAMDAELGAYGHQVFLQLAAYY